MQRLVAGIQIKKNLCSAVSSHAIIQLEYGLLWLILFLLNILFGEQMQILNRFRNHQVKSIAS